MKADGDYDHLSVASEEMDAIVLATEKATNDILQSTEQIQEAAWRLREAGASESDCEKIDELATDIYMACSFQDITGQRTTKVVRVLQYLEARINSMVNIWGLDLDDEKASSDNDADPSFEMAADIEPEHEIAGPHDDDARPDADLLNGPQMTGEALEQDNIDALMGSDFGAGNMVSGVAEPDMPLAAGELDGLVAMDGPEVGGDDVEQSTGEPVFGQTIDEERLKKLFH
jgi:hypothetical protein